MEKNIQMLNDDELDSVSGGFLLFNGDVLTYTQEGTGNVFTFKIVNYNAAWELNNLLHAQNHHEDYIIGQLMHNGYITT